MKRSFWDTLLNNWPFKVVSLVAAFILFIFYQFATLEERYFSVPLEIQVADGFIPTGTYPRNLRVTLRGKGENIFILTENDISVFLDLRDYKNEGVYKVPVFFAKHGNAVYIDPLEIGIEPGEITISLEKKVTKSLEIVPSIIGYPEKGFELNNYILTPTAVQAEGPSSQMDGLSSIRTEDINLSGRNETFTERVRLRTKDSQILFPGGEVVEFQGFIQERVIVRSFEPLEIITLDLDMDLEIEDPLPRGMVRVQGTVLSLENLSAWSIRLTADCSRIRLPGSYTVTVKPDVPPGIMVLNYEPEEVILRVRQKEELR